MHATTRLLLEKLLAHAEVEEASGKRKAFNLTPLRASAYLDEPKFDIKQGIHSELKDLAHEKALTIVWDRRAGHENLITGLSAASADAIAGALGVIRRKTDLESASALLSPYNALPRVQLARLMWARGKQVRGIGPDKASKLVDTILLIKRCELLTAPTAVRRISTSLFQRSKYAERLVPLVDFMTAATEEEALKNHTPHPADVLARIQLIRYAQPILLAGAHTLSFVNGTTRLIMVPYEGVAPESLDAIVTQPEYVMTVENLTTFHELATRQNRQDSGLILYTAGQPSPSFIACYQRIARFSGCQRFLHWGDVDGKGIEIAARLADALKASAGLRLQLWCMDSKPLESDSEREKLKRHVVSRMVKTCRRLGWDAVAKAIAGHRSRIEQEGQPLTWPSLT
ncbi:MAG: DUF2220 domain-containing protein [Nevskia sp.]|jgi:hypothetical protein|nr:DUF2220 domain-containing protein [Nevskia sp.]MCK9383034.1 DUF2220 domain-containing protein [Nevskia sp.]